MVTFEEILKFNPYHDSRGRFASANSAVSFSYKPGASPAHDRAIQREKDRSDEDGEEPTGKGFKGTLYHGSPSTDIEEFDINRAGENTSSGEKLIFFTDSKQTAEDFSYERLEGSTAFTQERGKKGRVYEVDVEMKRPLDFRNLSEEDIDNILQLDAEGILTRDLVQSLSSNHQLLKASLTLDAQSLKNLGYDGIIANMGKDGHNALEYGVVDSKQTQIKKSEASTMEAKTFNEILKFNPYHAADGKFTSSNGAGAATTAARIAELEAKLKTTVKVPVFSNGEVTRYVTNEGGKYKLTDDKSKAIEITDKNRKKVEECVRSQYKKKPLEMTGEEEVERETKLPYAEKKAIQDEISALRSGYESASDMKTAEAKRKQERFEKEKAIVSDSYFSQKAKKDEPFYHEMDGEIVCSYQSAARTIATEAKRMGAVETHTSAKDGSKYSSSVYLKIGDSEVRISNHRLPQTDERDARGTTRWNHELILTDGRMKELASQIKTQKDMESFVSGLFEGEDFSKADTEDSFSIFKTDDDKRLVFGWASVSITVDGEQLEDRQKDMIDPEDLEEAAYEYVLNFRDTGEEHIPTMRKKGKLVESCVLTAEKQKAMGIPEGILPIGWWIGFKIEDDEAWEKVKNRTYKMFSIEGKAKRIPVEKAAPVAKSFNEILKILTEGD